MNERSGGICRADGSGGSATDRSGCLLGTGQCGQQRKDQTCHSRSERLLGVVRYGPVLHG